MQGSGDVWRVAGDEKGTAPVVSPLAPALALDRGRLFEFGDSCNSSLRLWRSWRAAARRFLIEHFFQLRIARMSRGQSFLIMPAREFDRRLRLANVDHRQIV